jgi:hypothetical protein
LQLKEAKEQQERGCSAKQPQYQSVTASTTEEMDEDEIINWPEAIQTMEKLIPRVKPKVALRTCWMSPTEMILPTMTSKRVLMVPGE